MNDAMTIEEAGFSFSHERPEGVLSFLASRSKNSARALIPPATEVFKGCSDVISQLVRSTIETRSKAEFSRVFETAFPKYVALAFAMSHVAGAVVPKPVLERLTRETIYEMEADFRDKALAAFGAAVRDQALFTVWTLRKINELVTQIVTVNLDDMKEKEDAEYRTKFNMSIFRAHFSLDCLNMALQTGQPLYPEVSEELVDGLRAMVNAYAWARRGLEIRLPSEEPTVAIPSLDDEDRELMDASFCGASEMLNGEGA